MKHFDKVNDEFLIDAWQNNDFNLKIEDFEDLFGEEEWKLFLGYEPNPENTFEFDEDKFGTLFNDGLSMAFYPNRKKWDIILRRLIAKQLSRIDQLNDLEALIPHYIAVQLLISWEASCLFLGKMILEGWSLEKMREWFCNIFLIYRE